MRAGGVAASGRVYAAGAVELEGGGTVTLKSYAPARGVGMARRGVTIRGPRSGRPESGKGASVRRFAELLEGALANLADALAGDAHEGADLLERHRFRAFFEAVVEVEDLSLARREILLEYAIDKLAHQLVVGDFLDLGAVDAGEPFAQRG